MIALGCAVCVVRGRHIASAEALLQSTGFPIPRSECTVAAGLDLGQVRYFYSGLPGRTQSDVMFSSGRIHEGVSVIVAPDTSARTHCEAFTADLTPFSRKKHDRRHR